MSKNTHVKNHKLSKTQTVKKTQLFKFLFKMPKNCLKLGKYRELKSGNLDRKYIEKGLNHSPNA
jgi:hypothetical protein